MTQIRTKHLLQVYRPSVSFLANLKLLKFKFVMHKRELTYRCLKATRQIKPQVIVLTRIIIKNTIANMCIQSFHLLPSRQK